jgi:hypothetical protein
MGRFLIAALAFGACYSSASAKGICSTGAYKTCVSCCATHPAVTNRELCTYQCGDYKILERQKKASGNQ